MTRREQAEQAILEFCDTLCTNDKGVNRAYYEDHFKTLSDEEFDQYMINLSTGKEVVHVTLPNLEEETITKAHLLKVGKKYGVEFYQHLWFKEDGMRFKTPNKFMLLEISVRLVSQLWSKKVKIPKASSMMVDKMTNQPTRDSKGARLSKIEVSILAGLGLTKTNLELDKYRGGDLKGYNAMTTLLARHGNTTLDTIAPYSGEVKSKLVLSIALKAMHIDNNL